MTSAQTLADVAAAYLLKAQARADLQDSSDRAPEAVLHDAFAGLPNRMLMLERLEHAFLRGSRSKISAVFFVALDRFTAVKLNRHHIGDEMLVAVAERLTGVLRPGDHARPAVGRRLRDPLRRPRRPLASRRDRRPRRRCARELWDGGSPEGSPGGRRATARDAGRLS